MRRWTAVVVVALCSAACGDPRPEPAVPPAPTAPTAPPAPTIAAPAPFSFEKPRADVPSIRRWLLLGPFGTKGATAVTPAFIDEAAAAPSAGERLAGHVWTQHRILARRVDLGAALSGGDECAAYALTYLHVAAERDAVIWYGADNQSRVLVDGVVVHEYRTRDWDGPDAFGLAVHLAAGVHRLLLRVENCGGGHCFWLRIAGPDGAPLTDVRPSLAAGDSELAETAAANASTFTPAELLALLPRDGVPRIAFDDDSDLLRLAIGQGNDDRPEWIIAGGPDYGPSPGRRGAMALHAASEDDPQRAYWKIRVPDEPSVLRLVVSAEAFAAPGRADGVLRVGLFDGELKWLHDSVVASEKTPSPAGWREIALALPAASRGRDVLVVLEAATGGSEPWCYEGVWFDEIEVVPAR
jgi:hypothetical protein